MRTKTYQFYDILFPVKPNQEVIVPYVAFHVIFVISTEGMRLVFLWQNFSFCQHSDDVQQCFNFIFIFTDTFEVFFELSGFSYFFHHLIDAIKFSTLSILTMPASSPLSASFIAESVVSLGISKPYQLVLPFLFSSSFLSNS